jgi:hypothetical protein
MAVCNPSSKELDSWLRKSVLHPGRLEKTGNKKKEYDPPGSSQRSSHSLGKILVFRGSRHRNTIRYCKLSFL